MKQAAKLTIIAIVLIELWFLIVIGGAYFSEPVKEIPTYYPVTIKEYITHNQTVPVIVKEYITYNKTVPVYQEKIITKVIEKEKIVPEIREVYINQTVNRTRIEFVYITPEGEDLGNCIKLKTSNATIYDCGNRVYRIN